MKQKSIFIQSIIFMLLLTACETKDVNNLLNFRYSDNQAIIYNNTEYYYYGLPRKSDMKEQIGFLNGDDKHKIFLYQDYSVEEFIIEYYESGLMDNPVLYRAHDCDIEPTEVYISKD